MTDANGRTTTRPVASPADVGPTGKALLASPRDATPVIGVEVAPAPAPAPVAVPSPVVAQPPRGGESRSPPAADARLVLSPAIGARVSGPDVTAWRGGSLRGRIARDGELAPSSSLRIAEGFPRGPRYTLGLALGIEAVVH